MTKTGRRWRFIDDRKPHYISEKGYKPCWYGLNTTTLKRVSERYPLTICNGEISTVVGQHYGLAACCVTSGEKGLSPDHIQELKASIDQDTAIDVAMDCDETGRKAAHLVTQQLTNAGFNARAIDLGLERGGDLADFCMLHGQNAQSMLDFAPDLEPEQAQPQARRSWFIIPAADLAKLPPIEWVVPGEIPDRGITVLYGPSGSGKSFLALDYALTIAQHDPVLYIAAEGEYGYRQRVAAWCKHNGLAEGKLSFVIGAVQFLEPDDLAAFLAAASAHRPRLVIVDTLARSMVGADENSTRDMGLMVQACEMIKAQLNTAVMLVHHSNKGGIYERGSSALRGAADAMIKVYNSDDLIYIESAKTKDSQAFPTRYMQLVTIEIEIAGERMESAVMVPADRVAQTADDPLTPHQTKVLACLESETFGATRSEISEITSIPYASLQRILGRLQKLGYVAQDSNRAPYTITDTGRSRLLNDRSDRPSDRPDDRSATADSSLNDRYDRSDRPQITNGEYTANDHPRDHIDHIDHIDHSREKLPGFDRIDRTEAYQGVLYGDQ